MADLGFGPLRDEVYVAPLDGSTDWEARVVLPKQSGGPGQVLQEYPQAGLVHRDTERLIRELKGHTAGEGVDDVTVGTAGRTDLPEAEYPALVSLSVGDPSEITTVVAETVRMVRDVYLPLLLGLADVDRLVEVFDGPPPSRPARRFWLERRAVLHHLRGEDAAALAALAELASFTGSTGIEALDGPDRAFAAGLRARLTAA